MMNKIQTLLGAALIGAAAASAQTPGTLTVTLPANTDTLFLAPVPVADFYGSNRNGAIAGLADIVVVSGQTTYVLDLDPDEALAVIIKPSSNRRSEIVYAAPGETLTVDFTGPVNVMKGSHLVEGISQFNAFTDSVVTAYQALPSTATDAEREALRQSLTDRAFAMAMANKDNSLGMYMTGEIPSWNELMQAFDALGPGAKESFLSPIYARLDNMIARKRAIEAAAEAIKVGLPAPDFSLPDAQGNMVSLSQFKGKWVMLDFWGSWCGWCIKGIPQMKEQWAELKDRDVVFLSIACNDSKDTWLGALAKYDLPWVNVWSDPDTPSSQAVQSVYAVSGYPTKLVIDPQGNIALIVVGEDPSFYDQLRALL
jgi:peroxiredoxin